MSKSALASITAQYTDSENEDDHHEDESEDSGNSQASQVIIPKAITPHQSPEKPALSSGVDTKKKNTKSHSKKKVRRLVSYNDTVISDEDEEVVSESSEESESEDDEEDVNESYNSNTLHSSQKEAKNASPMEMDDETNDLARDSEMQIKNEKSDKYAHYGFSLPPEPKGKPNAELVAKIRQLYEKMGTSNMDMNRMIQGRKEFRNPSIYEKLIQFCDINEFGTNYPPEIYDPLQWGEESYYEELARVQKNEMLKRQKERKESDKIEQATALARKVEEEAKKRKSKWDQPAKPVVPPALTTTVTGTKGTVISAFGSLPKKPAQ